MAAQGRFSVEIGARLRRARVVLGMSLRDVQEQSGGRWKAVTLRSYETATRALVVENFVDLSRFYGLDPGCWWRGRRGRR